MGIILVILALFIYSFLDGCYKSQRRSRARSEREHAIETGRIAYWDTYSKTYRMTKDNQRCREFLSHDDDYKAYFYYLSGGKLIGAQYFGNHASQNVKFPKADIEFFQKYGYVTPEMVKKMCTNR